MNTPIYETGPVSQLELFTNGEFELNAVREDDEWRVLAPGLARGLGYRDATAMLRGLPDACKGYTNSCTPGGDQQIWYVTEVGLYRLLGQRQTARIKDSRVRLFVERFQGWVFGEVLPSLRRTGQYQLPTREPAELSRRELLTMALEELDRRETAEAMVRQLEPQAAAWGRLESGAGHVSVAEAAQILSQDPNIYLGRGRLFALLASMEWIYRGADERWRIYQPQVDQELLFARVSRFQHPRTGEETLSVPQVRITAKGLRELHRELGGTHPSTSRAALALPSAA